MNKPRVLVVENSHIVLQVIMEILSKHGYPITGALTSTEKALESVQLQQPDIVLMAIGPNGSLSGIQAAEFITRKYDIPVIFMTDKTDVALLEDALKSECSTYLVKPIQEAELIINIEIAVQNHRIAARAEKARRWHEAILDGVIDAVVAEDDTGRIVYMNNPAIRLLEADENFFGETISTFVTFLDMDGNPLDDLDASVHHMECQMRTRSGVNHVILIKTQTLVDPIQNINVTVMTLSNITDEWVMQEKIRFMTFHDSLTGLYNRNFLEEELVRLNTERQLPISVIMADLNGLKIINDILGHVDGDLLLKACAHQLKEACRDEDIIARFGGDEFLIFLPVTTESDVRHIVKRIRSGSERVITPLGPMSIALGHYTKESLDETIQSAIMRADEDMYRDKDLLKKDYYQNCFNYVYDALQRHPYEGSHFTAQVIQLMEEMIGLREDLNEGLRDIRHLGQVYDIGMICLPTWIYKFSRFNEGDLKQIQKHSEISYKIVNLSPNYSHVAEAVLYHHERWDGRGYPYHLTATEIPILARILSVVDAYCSMIRPRNYRGPLSPQDALREIAGGAGTQFDPDVVDLFITMMNAHDETGQ